MVGLPSAFVTDTNVWIDLHIAELLDHTFRLPCQWFVPDVIAEELEVPNKNDLITRGLRIRELTGEQVLEVAALAKKYVKPSRTDLFALVLAKALNFTLLTGDAGLREAAEQEGVTVHGILWLIDHLVDQGILASRPAGQALKRMREKGSRLPEDEVQKRLLHWQ